MKSYAENKVAESNAPLPRRQQRFASSSSILAAPAAGPRNTGAPADAFFSWRKIGLGVFAVLLLGGCSRANSAAQPPAEKHYPLTGEIVSVDQAKKVLVVRHEDVPGLMPAMTMEFAVSAGDAAVAKTGQRI